MNPSDGGPICRWLSRTESPNARKADGKKIRRRRSGHHNREDSYYCCATLWCIHSFSADGCWVQNSRPGFDIYSSRWPTPFPNSRQSDRKRNDWLRLQFNKVKFVDVNGLIFHLNLREKKIESRMGKFSEEGNDAKIVRRPQWQVSLDALWHITRWQMRLKKKEKTPEEAMIGLCRERNF